MSESNAAAPPPKSLPPVTPPSGRFLAQLFLVPGTIVFVAVLLLLMFRNLFGSGHTSDEFLRMLDSNNPDIRWRGASDLAQILSKPESLPLQCDTEFAQRLSERLHDAFAELQQDEKSLQASHKDGKVPDQAWLKLRPQRKYIRFLTAAVGRFRAPVAIPVLTELVQRNESPDVKGNTLIRRQALWSLALLGDNIQNFKTLPPEHQAKILQELKESTGPQRTAWNRTALYYLDKNQLPPGANLAEIPKMDEVLARCAEADDPYFRELVALSLLFWNGPQVEPTLLKLAQDNGHGTTLRIEDED